MTSAIVQQLRAKRQHAELQKTIGAALQRARSQRRSVPMVLVRSRAAAPAGTDPQDDKTQEGQP